MAFFGRLRRWRKGDRDASEKRNEVIDRVQELTPLLGSGQIPGTAGNGIFVNRTPLGTIITQRDVRPIEGRLGVIRKEGPKKQNGSGNLEDFPDNRYWVKFGDVNGITENFYPGMLWHNQLVTLTPPVAGDSQKKSFPDLVCVQNLSEIFPKTHSLPTDGSMVVWCWPYRDSYGQLHWLMREQAPRVWIKITGSASGGGKYNARVVGAPTGNMSASGNLTEAECAETARGGTVLAFNVREVGESTHVLETSGYLPLIFLAQYVGMSTDTPAVPTFVFDGLQGEEC